MKEIKSLFFIIIVFSLTIFNAQAQRTVSSGSIQLISQRSDVLQIELGGLFRFTDNVAGGVLLANLLPGEYWLKVSTNNQRTRRSLMYIVDQNIRVQPGQRTIINIVANNRVNISFVPEHNSIMLCVDGRERYEPQVPQMIQAISEIDFNRLLAELRKYNFESDKQKLLDASTIHNFFLSDQLGRVMATFQSDNSKLQCAKMLIPKVIDPENLYLQANVFTFSSSRDEYLKLIRSR